MPLPPDHARIDIVALKSQISHRLGPDRSRQYFNALNRLLAQKLSKQDFQRFCISTLGRGHISLHNQLLLAILKNACLAKSPPATLSPSKVHSGIRTKDRLSPIGPNGRAEVGVHHNLDSSDEPVIRDNGGLSPACDLKRPFDEAEREEISPLSAPLGLPFCQASVGGARKSAPLFSASSSGGFSCNYDCDELCHTEDLKKRMENIAEVHGLGGVSIESAQLLNNGVDIYLKRLIKSSIELRGVRPCHSDKQHINRKQINGVCRGSSIHLQGSDGCAESHTQRGQHFVSLEDFKVAMELNQQQLGEDWALLLERICIRSFEKYR